MQHDKRFPPHWVSQFPWLLSLPEQQLMRLVAQHKRLSIPEGQTIAMVGDDIPGIYLVTQGWIKLYHMTQDGQEAITALKSIGDSVGHSILSGKSTFPYTIDALDEVKAILLPKEVIWDQLDAGRTTAQVWFTMMEEDHQRLALQLEHLSVMTAKEKIGCFFLSLCHQSLDKPQTVSLPTNKGIIARFLGMEPETFSRSLGALASLGVECNGLEVSITNPLKLRHSSCLACSMPNECKPLPKHH